jgi:hypothetical protein
MLVAFVSHEISHDLCSGREVPRYSVGGDELRNHYNHQLFPRESGFMSLGKRT